MVSPGWAVTVFGLKARTPVPPTITLWSLLDGTADVVETGVVADETVGGEPAEAAAFAWKVAKSEPGLTAKTIP